MSKYEAVLPIVEQPGRRTRGRPTAQGPGVVPLYNFPGPSKAEKLQQLYDDWYNCKRCLLGQLKGAVLEGTGEDIVFFSGNPDAHILIIGEAPGEQEDQEKKPFIGPSGQLLNMILAKYTDDIDAREAYENYGRSRRTNRDAEMFHEAIFAWREREFAITNVVACRPPENRTPTMAEAKACWERLWNIIYIVDPLLIVVCGNLALSVVTKKLSAHITKFRGQIFDVSYDGKIGKLTYPVMPTFHPSYLGRVADWKLKGGAWAKTEEDWLRALQRVDFLRYHQYGTPIPNRTP